MANYVLLDIAGVPVAFSPNCTVSQSICLDPSYSFPTKLLVQNVRTASNNNNNNNSNNFIYNIDVGHVKRSG
jgi:hypothetical protein